MATISENLVALNEAKQSIKSAIENKGQDLTGVPFTEYGGKIEAIQTGGGEDMLQARVDATNKCDYLMYSYSGNNVDFLANLDTSNVTDMASMFDNNTNITKVPLFDTKNVTRISGMFRYCSKLESLPQYDFSSVTMMPNFLYGCAVLKTLPDLNLNNIEGSMENAFFGCNKLTEIPQLDTSKVTSMYSVFYNCFALTTIPQLNLESCTSLQNTFYNCTTLTEIPELNTSKVVGMSSAFWLCSKLKTIKLLDMRSAKNVSNIFNGCRALENLTLKNINITLQIGSGTSYGHLLTLDSLLNTIKELWDNSANTSTKTLTMGTANTAKLANVYVKLIDITDEMRAEDEYIDNKKPFVVCESTDEGAMLITEYVTSKKWQLA